MSDSPRPQPSLDKAKVAVKQSSISKTHPIDLITMMIIKVVVYYIVCARPCYSPLHA